LFVFFTRKIITCQPVSYFMILCVIIKIYVNLVKLSIILIIIIKTNNIK
jgi:hypothetical protein